MFYYEICKIVVNTIVKLEKVVEFEKKIIRAIRSPDVQARSSLQ